MTDERQCRLCYTTGDIAENRLFSPCLCSGTQRYIHEQCLDEWRQAAHAQSNYFECPVCNYHYRLQRIPLYHVLVHWALVMLMTALTTLTCTGSTALLIKVVSGAPHDRNGDVLIVTITLLGILGLGWELYASGCDTWLKNLRFPPLIHPGMLIGIILVAGFVAGVRQCGLLYYHWSRAALHAVGDRVLDVQKKRQ